MIYYFSGTGNTRHVAMLLSQATDHTLTSITPDTMVVPSSTIGILFPVYAWGLPSIVVHFLERNRPIISSASYIYTVMTCGDDIGYADHTLTRILGRQPDAIFSVPMPNTYVCLPGFDIDSPDMAHRKVKTTHGMITHIAETIQAKRTTTEVERGSTPWLKTYILRHIFNRFLVTDRYFHTTQSCTLCHRCVASCPMHNISVTNHVCWGNTTCTGCLRCYHLCPNRAIEFGPFTKNKGQKIPINENLTGK